MNNEPVAYGMFIDGDFYDAIHADEYKRVEGKYDIPLYSHPVKEDAQYDKGFDEGVKHGKTIYEAEIEALKFQNDNYWLMVKILRQKVEAQDK